MAHEGQVLARLDAKIEVREHGLLVRVSKVQVLEADLSAQPGHVALHGLHDIWIGIDERIDAFSRRQSLLNLRPERRQVLNREEEVIKADDEQIPGADRDQSLCQCQASAVDEYGGEDARGGVQHRKDQR